MDNVNLLHGFSAGNVWAQSPQTGSVDMGGTVRGVLGAGYRLSDPSEARSFVPEGTFIGLEALGQATSWYGGTDYLLGGKLVLGQNNINFGVIAGYQHGPVDEGAYTMGAELNFNPVLPLMLIPGVGYYGLVYEALLRPMVLSVQVRGDSERGLPDSLRGGVSLGWGF
ncbi:MAG: hypothetical protein Q7T11_02585 [Deltaproteobacteria bacterium]|nr:hypothetical protein [Deltaproteobacteria bacterium]